MPTHYDSLPDIAIGHHPAYGIVAANPKHLLARAWMLKGFDFHPVPDQPTLYALCPLTSKLDRLPSKLERRLASALRRRPRLRRPAL